ALLLPAREGVDGLTETVLQVDEAEQRPDPARARLAARGRLGCVVVMVSDARQPRARAHCGQRATAGWGQPQ
ncbi:hypothetical protein, partial [Actinomadura luteofluorescens]